MRFPKSLLFELSREGGSAVLEFVVVVLPASLIVLVVQGFFGFATAIQISQQQTYEIARYAALADVTAVEVEIYSQKLGFEVELKKVHDSFGCSYLAKRDQRFEVWGWPFPIEVEIEAEAACEI